jgi:hypothetical protein
MRTNREGGSLTIANSGAIPTAPPTVGTEEEVLDLAVLHAINVHAHEDTPERRQIGSMLEDEGKPAAA